MTSQFSLRDKFGNITRVLADDAFGHHRESTTVYDVTGEYPEKYVNALQQETRIEYDKVLGVAVKETDANGLVTQWTYDTLGQLQSEKRPEGSETTIQRTRENIDGVWQIRQRTTTTGGADDEMVFDNLGRPIKIFSYGPLSSRQVQFIEYDRSSGKVARRSVPTNEDTPFGQVKWDEYQFDAVGRKVGV